MAVSDSCISILAVVVNGFLNPASIPMWVSVKNSKSPQANSFEINYKELFQFSLGKFKKT